MLDISLIKKLLHEDESTTLDFKRDQYAFEGADDNTKSELLKDILAFTNAWRRTSAYILIGVDEKSDGRSKVFGISKELDDAKLQQFVNTKTQKPIEFSCRTFKVDGSMVGVIEIPVQERPIYLVRAFGKLEKEKVYIRRGSSTGTASPDEISKMGTSLITKTTPHLVFEWADLDSHRGLSSLCTVQTLLLDPLVSHKSLKSYEPSNLSFPEQLHGVNRDYPKEIIKYTYWIHAFQKLGFRLLNKSEVVAKRIRFIGSIAKKRGILIRDWSDRPIRPRRSHFDIPHITPIAEQLRDNPDPCVKGYEEYWEVNIEFGDVRPRDEIWTTTPILIGTVDSREVKLEGELRGDNLPEPIGCTLNANLEVEKRPMENADVQQYMKRN